MAAITATAAAPRANPATYAGLFVVTLTTLMYEIVLTRIFSVTMFYHFAFVAISVALFGMTLGALIVYLKPERFPDSDLKNLLWRYSLLFSGSIVLSFITQMAIPFSPHWNVVSMFSVVATCVVISVPFIMSGIVVCLALTRFPDRVNRLYAADLVGAALGCVLFVVLLNTLDAPSAVIAIAALAAIAGILFASDAGHTRGMTWSCVALFGFGAFALLNGYLAEQREPILRIIWAKEAAEPKYPYEQWNAFSRVTVDGDPNLLQAPFGWGMSSELPEDVGVNQLTMTIDGGAATVLTRYFGNEEQTDFLRYDITNLGHYIKQDADVMVVGVGGGRDILSAFEFEQRSVTGVEINRQILETTNGAFGEFTGHLDRDPRVTIIEDEARSYLARTDRRFDMIQISLIDTWAASAAGAFALTENSLYTTEAWEMFLSRLKPGGVLTVSRWYTLNGDTPLETYRMTALAAQVLKDRGVENPRDHMVVYHGPESGFRTSAATLILSADPISAADLATLDREAARLKFTPVITPTESVNEDFAGLVSPEGPGATIRSFDEDISAPTDNRPFFFQMTDVGSFFNGSAFQDTHVTRPALVLAVLAFTVIGLAIVCIAVPLLITTERSAHTGMLPFYTYFAGIGLGFLLIEISQLQRLSIFLGHPTYALTVVLFSVLLSSGIGSMLSETIARTGNRLSLLAPLVVLMIGVIAFGLITPDVIHATEGETTTVRIAIAVALLMPLGLVMGMPFPIGMRVASTRPGAPTAFFWGINGATSVCASVLGMAIALFFGISASFWAGAAAYMLAVSSMVFIAMQTSTEGAPAEAVAAGGVAGS